MMTLRKKDDDITQDIYSLSQEIILFLCFKPEIV